MANNQDMDMQPQSVQEFFMGKGKGNYFIPNYQRAYSWGPKQLEQWLDDIAEIAKSEGDKQYFMGRILLEKTDDGLAVIDGQQRLTTILLFLCAAKAVFKTRAACDSKEHCSVALLKEVDLAKYSAKLTLGEVDDSFFRELIAQPPRPEAIKENGKAVKKTGKQPNTKSQHKLWQALVYFVTKLQKNESEVPEYCALLLLATVAVIKVKDKRSATLMFQLENDRGVDLTAMEKLKAFLMYEALVHSEQVEEDLAEIAGAFDEIGEILFKLRVNPETILKAHYQAYITPSSNPYRDYSLGRVKEYIRGKDGGEEKKVENPLSRIKKLCKELLISFKNVEVLEGKRIEEYVCTFKYLDAPGFVWPFLLCEMKEHSYNKQRFGHLLAILGELALRDELVRYNIGGNLPSITANKRLGTIFNNFRSENNVEKLGQVLSAALEGKPDEHRWVKEVDAWKVSRFKGDKNKIWSHAMFSKFLSKRYLGYTSNSGYYPDKLLKFFLFQYELIALENNKIDLNEEWHLEHIAPKGNRKNHEDYGDANDSIECIGNKCLLEANLNSRASDRSFAKKLEIYETGFVKEEDSSSDKEKPASLEQVKELSKPVFTLKREKRWDEKAIGKRNKKLRGFIEENYKPKGNCKRVGAIFGY